MGTALRGSQVIKVALAFFFGALLCAAQYYRCAPPEPTPEQCAAFLKGYSYDTGTNGFEQDYKQAAEWYSRAAMHDYPWAQWNLGILFMHGNGVPHDDAKAFLWFLMAATSGLVDAQVEVGLFYSLGNGVPQDYEASAEWLRKAAEQGNTAGQRWLGTAYELGQGVPQDYVQAHMWLNLSGAQGNEDARKERDKLAAKMTMAQIAEAQRLAREFKPKVP
jgi:uncharacterized protein